MSISSNSPATSELPRRTLLKALAASPAAAAAIAADTFSSNRPEFKDDPRFVRADELMRAINAAYDEFLKTTDYEFGDEAGEARYDAAGDRFDAARDELKSYAEDLASKTPKNLKDALVLAKIADFQLVNDRDIIENLSDVAPNALRAILEAHGVQPTSQTSRSLECEKLAAAIASSGPSATPNFKPDSVIAGEDIAELRRLSAAHEKAHEDCGKLAGTWGSSPESVAARTQIERSFEELCRFTEAVKQKIGRRYAQRDDFVVLGNLVLAIDTIYVDELNDEVEFFQAAATIDGHRNRALSTMFELARTAGDRLVREAAIWNAEHGDADV